MSKNGRKRYAIVGTGGRCVAYIDGIVDWCKDHAELVGFCDTSPTRMNWHNARIGREHGHAPVPTYRAEAFDRMVGETKPDVVVVTTIDCLHHQYIVRAMELGCDVISEKPMTTDVPKAKAILAAMERTGRHLRVTFNFRYGAAAGRIRRLIMDGAIGRPLAVDFSWILNTSHGADYFRRWHREKDQSGGLLIHKGSHHFDGINWWVGSYPKTVFALGDLMFYGRENARRRGETYSYSRYTGEPAAAKDPFALRLDEQDGLKGLYLDAEKDSGYIRDRNVFGENITTEDTLSLTARYRNGVILTYSLVAYSPWEGMRASVTGDKGRVELVQTYGTHIIAGQSDKELAAQQSQGRAVQVTLYPMFGAPQDIEIPELKGGHGGSDPVLIRDLLDPNPGPDPLGRRATYVDGAASLLVGAAANESIRTGQPIHCDDLLKLPEHP